MMSLRKLSDTKEVHMTSEVKKRFVKDESLPIQLLKEPYFSYYICLYNRDFDTVRKYGDLHRALERCGSEEKFLQEYYGIRDRVITRTKELPEYAEFLECDMSKYDIEAPVLPNAHKTDVYKMVNVDRRFISIDMKKANFQVMKMFSEKIVFGADTYEEYIGRFTDMDYFRNSKYTRQVIFGNMNPKRQTKMQKYCMRKVFDLLIAEYDISPEAFAVFTFDEIVLRRDMLDERTAAAVISGAGKKIMDGLGIAVRVKPFTLRSIGGRDFYANEVEDGTVEFKKAPSIFFAQIYKKYYGMELCDNDLMFYHEGYMAKFQEPLFD